MFGFRASHGLERKESAVFQTDRKTSRGKNIPGLAIICVVQFVYTCVTLTLAYGLAHSKTGTLAVCPLRSVQCSLSSCCVLVDCDAGCRHIQWRQVLFGDYGRAPRQEAGTKETRSGVCDFVFVCSISLVCCVYSGRCPWISIHDDFRSANPLTKK
jgi:hypothetical protein